MAFSGFSQNFNNAAVGILAFSCTYKNYNPTNQTYSEAMMPSSTCLLYLIHAVSNYNHPLDLG